MANLGETATSRLPLLCNPDGNHFLQSEVSGALISPTPVEKASWPTWVAAQKNPVRAKVWCRLGTQSSVYMECCFRSSDLTADTDSRTQFTGLAKDPGRKTLCPQQYCFFFLKRKYFVSCFCFFVLEKHKSPSTVLINKNLNSLIKFQNQNKRLSGKSFSSKLVTNHL